MRRFTWRRSRSSRRSPAAAQDPVVEAARVVHDDHDAPRAAKRPPRPPKDGGDVLAVPRHAAPDLVVVSSRQAEQLERVGVLLVVVDEPRVRRRGEDEVDRPGWVDEPRIAVEDGHGRVRAELVELANAAGGVANVAPEELVGLRDGAADAAVLVAEVLAADRLPREVEVVVAGKPGRAGRTREDEAPELGVGGAVDPAAEGEELGDGLRREPALEVRQAVRERLGHRRGGRREPHDVPKRARADRMPPSSRA